MTRFPWRHQYDDERDAHERANTDVKCEDESLTQQHFTEDADINVLVRRFGITDGAIPPAAAHPAHYGDFSDAADFRTALDRTRDAVEKFNALPAKLRERFANDPTRLWEFVNDESNVEESIQLGLLHRTAAAEPEKQPKTEPPAA